MPELLVDVWKRFRNRFQLANEHLATEMAAAGEDIRQLMDRLRDQLASITADPLDPGNVGSFELLFGDLENHLFSDPVEAFERLGPIARTLSAIEQHKLEMNNLARGLPPEITISGAELVEIIEPDVRKGWQKEWVKRRRSPQLLKLREIVLAHLWGQVDRRASIDGAFELVLAQAGLHLVAAWQVYRRHQLAILAGDGKEKTALGEERTWWSRTGTVLTERIARMVTAYQHWSEVSAAELGAAVLRRSPRLSAHRQSKISERWQTDFSHWHRQRRAVLAVIDLERQLSIVARDMCSGHPPGTRITGRRTRRRRRGNGSGGRMARSWRRTAQP